MKTEAEGYAHQGTLRFMRFRQGLGRRHGMTSSPSGPPEALNQPCLIPGSGLLDFQNSERIHFY